MSQGDGAPKLRPSVQGLSSARSYLPLAILVGVNVALGFLFYQVVRPLILPLFLAAVVAMLLQPSYRGLAQMTGGRERLAAGVVTALIVLLILVPLGAGLALGVGQLYGGLIWLKDLSEAGKLKPLFEPRENPTLASLIERVEHAGFDLEQAKQWAVGVARGAGENLYHRSIELLTDLPGFLLMAVMFVVALYFFFVDGKRMMSAWDALTPLDTEHDRLIRREFVKVCRGVVWATLVAAVAQGVLVGLGLFVIDLFLGVGSGKWIFLVTLLSTVFALIPFVGAAAAWGGLTVMFIFQGHYAAAVIMAIHGAVIVSTVDNLIKIVMLRDSANMHPLLVFVCVFGGMDLFGVLGIFIGPIVGAVLVAVLRILKRELIAVEGPESVRAAQGDLG